MRKREYKADPRPKNEPARNRASGIIGATPEEVDLDGDVGSNSHKRQALRYFNGRSESGPNEQFEPEDIDSKKLQGNDLGEVIDLSGRKLPYGGKAKGWGANAGKLGDLDPQETDQPSWVNTWSPLNTGPYGAGVTTDENYGVRRPRTYTRQKERFQECNPEFQDVADEGDWTSHKFNPNI